MWKLSYYFLFTLFLFTYESANRSLKALPNGSYIEIVFCYTYQRQIVNWSALFTFLNSEIRTYIIGARIRRRFNADVDVFVSIWSYMYMCVEERKKDPPHPLVLMVHKSKGDSRRSSYVQLHIASRWRRFCHLFLGPCFIVGNIRLWQLFSQVKMVKFNIGVFLWFLSFFENKYVLYWDVAVCIHYSRGFISKASALDD